MKNKFFTNNKTADDAATPSNMELLKKSITKFCMDIAEYEDEAEAALCKVHWDEEVDPIMYWRFCPVCTFEDNRLSDKQVEALVKLDYPIAACYEEWQKNDVTYMDRLRDVVDDVANDLIKQNEAEKQNNKKRHEPER